MKTKIFTLFILVTFACLPIGALAYERNFPAGSIIIPMDSFYQPEADGGQLEAYGLAYYLLDHQDPQCMADASTDDVTIACQETCVRIGRERGTSHLICGKCVARCPFTIRWLKRKGIGD